MSSWFVSSRMSSIVSGWSSPAAERERAIRICSTKGVLTLLLTVSILHVLYYLGQDSEPVLGATAHSFVAEEGLRSSIIKGTWSLLLSTYLEASNLGPVLTLDVFFFSSLAADGGSGRVFLSTLKNQEITHFDKNGLTRAVDHNPLTSEWP